jgi:hypothetical protein
LQDSPLGKVLPWPEGKYSGGEVKVRFVCETLQNYHACVAIYLLHEKNNFNSIYRPWIQTLPHFVGNALDLSNTHLSQLAHTSAGFLASQIKQTFEEIWEGFVLPTFQKNPQWFPKGKFASELLTALETFTKEAFEWAFKIILSRSAATEMGPILLPVADYANHPDIAGQDNSKFELVRAGAVLRATRF